jgi:hypothetical protein
MSLKRLILASLSDGEENLDISPIRYASLLTVYKVTLQSTAAVYYPILISWKKFVSKLEVTYEAIIDHRS